MEADFTRFYGADLATCVWGGEWSVAKVRSHVHHLSDDSAYVRSLTKGHTVELEALAQIRDRLDFLARGLKAKGEHKPFPRPGERERQREALDIANPEHARRIAGFFRG